MDESAFLLGIKMMHALSAMGNGNIFELAFTFWSEKIESSALGRDHRWKRFSSSLALA
jgi:hypothetical protein